MFLQSCGYHSYDCNGVLSEIFWFWILYQSYIQESFFPVTTRDLLFRLFVCHNLCNTNLKNSNYNKACIQGSENVICHLIHFTLNLKKRNLSNNLGNESQVDPLIFNLCKKWLNVAFAILFFTGLFPFICKIENNIGGAFEWKPSRAFSKDNPVSCLWGITLRLGK